MADSNITKKALAAALKELMMEMPFQKICVADIAGRCQMNRKSFYYHFRDKYDLMNWIYDVEFFQVSSQKNYDSLWEYTEELCNFFYENREFYRKAFKIEGQNSFIQHFKEVSEPVVQAFLRSSLDSGYLEFSVNFYCDAFLCALVRWMTQKECISPEEFLTMLKSCIQCLVKRAGEYGIEIDS